MFISLIDLAITSSLTLLGVGLGWWLRASLAGWGVSTDDAEGRTEVSRAREALGRLHDLAARVAADVGEHSHRVEEINEELLAAEGGETATVLAAVAKLVKNNGEMQKRLASAEDKLQQQKQLIASTVAEARTDALTGVSNRRALGDELAQRIADFRADGRPVSLAILDVDHFKKFNDTFGHQAGDEVLRGVAHVLRSNTRQTDMVARYGGEEFAIVIRHTTAVEAAAYVDRTRAAIETAVFSYNGQALHVKASLGVSQLLNAEEAAAWIERSDTALYAAKANGRNNVHWHDGEHPHRYTAPGEPRPLEEREPPAKPASAPRVAPVRTPVAEAKAEPAPSEVAANPLARLLNRTGFCTNVNNRLAEYRRGGAAPSVVLTHLDHCEPLMAEQGQQVLDTVLRATTKFLLAAVREMDSVASYDATTFAMLFPATSLGDTAAAIERLRHTIEQSTITSGGRAIRFTLSFGAATANGSDDLERLLRRTEQALQTATWSGGNVSYCHNGVAPETAAATLQRLKAAIAAT